MPCIRAPAALEPSPLLRGVKYDFRENQYVTGSCFWLWWVLHCWHHGSVSSEVLKIFCNNICESVRIMVPYGFSLLDSVRITGSLMTSESPDHLNWRQSLNTQLLECWALCYLIRSASSKHPSLSPSLSSTARPAAITVWIKILLNTLLPLQSDQRVWFQLMMVVVEATGEWSIRSVKIWSSSTI